MFLFSKCVSNYVTARRHPGVSRAEALRSEEAILSSNQQTLHFVQGDNTQSLDPL